MSDPNVNDALAHAYQSIEQMQAQLDSNHRLLAALYQILGTYEAPVKVLDMVTEALDGKVVDADKLLPVKEPQPKGLDWAIARCDALMSQGFDRILIAAMKADFVNAKEAGVDLQVTTGIVEHAMRELVVTLEAEFDCCHPIMERIDEVVEDITKPRKYPLSSRNK